MGSNDKDTDEASPKKKTHSNFEVEWLKNPDLKS